MSSFCGQMNDHKWIAIDRFDGRNLQCTMFFLSHCHTDHMIGLKSQLFFDVLHLRSNYFLYCSEVTRLLLLAEDDYTHLKDYIVPLEVGVVHHLKVPSSTSEKEDYFIKVTLIPAGHCPGSVMFLFEGPKSTSLYTGDFRWEINQASKIPAFRCGDRLKAIDTMYVDTTFCIPEAYHIPTRSECLAAAVTLVSEWIKSSVLHVVNISCPAKYGYENFLASLAQKIGSKVHIPEWKVLLYEQIPDLKGYFTSDPKKAQIHACSFKKIKSAWKSLPCGHHASDRMLFQVLNIRLSTMWFTSQSSRSRKEDLLVAPKSKVGIYRVCYSMHSSYSEIRDLVSYLQPKLVMPNVIPVSDKSIDIVQARLSGFKNFPRNDKIASTQDGLIQPLGVLQKSNVEMNINRQIPMNSFELVFDSPELSDEQESFKTEHTCFISELCQGSKKNSTSSEVSTVIKEKSSPCCSGVQYEPEQLSNQITSHNNFAIINIGNDEQTSSSRLQEKISLQEQVEEPKCFDLCSESDSDITPRLNHLADSANQTNQKYPSTGNVNYSGSNVGKFLSEQLVQFDVDDSNKSNEIKHECDEVIPNSQESLKKVCYFWGKNRPKRENLTQSVKIKGGQEIKEGQECCKVSQGSLSSTSSEKVTGTKNIQSTSLKDQSPSAISVKNTFNFSKRKLCNTEDGTSLSKKR
ncbi:unnamed protein product [Lymnaea stagnalis]|uniref:Protein artemis n=1 Tax=Lymnaea stagnalis TaxID=6523 RepID=A0AAV2IDQ3_LYMST